MIRLTKYDREAALVTRLLAVVGVPYTSVTDPMVTYGGETGADVAVRISGRVVGVQVTEYCPDEGISNPGRGLRATEKRNTQQRQFSAAWIPLQHQLPSLGRRVSDKVEKARRYAFNQFDEVWLLVAASLAQPDAIVSTFLIPQLLTPSDVNRCLDDGMLRCSRYTQAFIHIQVGDTIYHWTRDSCWRLIRGVARREPTGGDLWFKAFLPPFPPRRV